jgi:hypothetical protein
LSKYQIAPLDLRKLRTISIHGRGGKVRAEDFAAVYSKGSGFAGWLESLPKILAGQSLVEVVTAIERARDAGRPVVWGIGGHVIKCGLAPVVADLMDRGFITAIAMNGAAAIHDFEIAIAGHTSEDVEAVLPDGTFGTAEETGREMNVAIAQGNTAGLGIGEALGRQLERIVHPSFADSSLLLRAYKRAVPVTVHVAIGTDTPHTHPAAHPAALGSATHRDFRLFCTLVAGLDGGGVYVNAGSAVMLPEVFLKAVSAVRNVGHPLREFTTVNLDFLQHYRPRVNVVERPHAGAGGKGYSLVGHHEILIPLLAAALIERQQ